MFKILFVCMGNICRSPAAECIMRKIINENNLSDSVSCDSSGTISYHSGSYPDSRMRKAGKKRGFDFVGQARAINENDLVKFDMIIGMDNENVSYIQNLDYGNKNNDKIFLFTDFCDKFKEINGVPDPYYGGERGFDNVIDIILDGCQNILSFVKEKVN